MTNELKETIRSSLVPIVLGNGLAACRTAWRLYFSLGTVALRLGSHRHPTDLIGLPCVFRKASTDDRLFVEQLLDIAEEFDGYLLLLIPTDEPSRRRVDAAREALETRYILSSPSEVFSHIPCFYQNER